MAAEENRFWPATGVAIALWVLATLPLISGFLSLADLVAPSSPVSDLQLRAGLNAMIMSWAIGLGLLGLAELLRLGVAIEANGRRAAGDSPLTGARGRSEMIEEVTADRS